MQVILKLLNNKIFLYAIIAAAVSISFGINKCQSNAHAEFQRQLEGKLSKKEQELQTLNARLGVSQSELLAQDELYQKLKNDKEEINREFERFKKKHRLQIVSRDKTIADLRQRLKGGTTTTTIVSDKPECSEIEKCIIEYTWQDDLSRFKLKDPNIFNSGDEEFESRQIFKIYGEVYRQKDGFLKTRRLVLREVFKNSNDEYEPIEGGKANIIDSDFQYAYADTPIEERGLFKLLPIAVGSVGTEGKTQLGFGIDFLKWNSFSLNTHTAFVFNDLKSTTQNIGLAYTPTILGNELNVAFGISVGTPLNNLFDKYLAKLDLLFYISD